jgi:hypothetical protein
MKRFLTSIAVTLIALPVAAGVTYDFTSVADGRGGTSLKGKASIDGKNMRLDLSEGDGALFKNNSTIISNDGGNTLLVIDPKDKSYYEFNIQEVFSSLGSLMGAAGGLVKMSIDNQSVNVTEAGDGGTIEGYATRKYVIESSYDMSIRVMGMNNKSRVESVTEAWTTDKLGRELATFVQHRGLRTGIDDFDRLIDSQTNAMKGFPIKQVIKTTTTQGRRTQTQTTTMTVTNVKHGAVDASLFKVPAGFTKKESPMAGLPQR